MGAHELEVLAAGVIWISPQKQKEYPAAELTEYVIVFAYRYPADARVRVLQDGKSEPFPHKGSPGEIHWQLDAGHFVDRATLGPLWYQQRGWSCRPNDGTITGEICARLKL